MTRCDLLPPYHSNASATFFAGLAQKLVIAPCNLRMRGRVHLFYSFTLKSAYNCGKIGLTTKKHTGALCATEHTLDNKTKKTMRILQLSS